MKNGINFQQFVNYWLEPFTSIDTYGNQLTLKYPDTDTIYRYDSPANELVPQYIISTHEEKGDYGATHVRFRERSAFDYFPYILIIRVRIISICCAVRGKPFILIVMANRLEK